MWSPFEPQPMKFRQPRQKRLPLLAVSTTSNSSKKPFLARRESRPCLPFTYIVGKIATRQMAEWQKLLVLVLGQFLHIFLDLLAVFRKLNLTN